MGATCPKCRHDNPPDTLFCGRCATRLDGSGAGVSFTRTMETPGGEYGRGTVFAGRFEVIEELGAGGMGRVLRAFDKEVGEEVAVKLLHPEIALDKKTVERFRNEIKLARKITHKNVCRMHELHQEGTTLFITMEFVSGQDLKGLIKQTGALTTGKAISVARQVAEGLAEAHSLGVVHRDLKPQNIMVDKDGNAKIMDFGIARSLHGAGVTAEGSLIGTPDYMSPEQVEGKGADQRADIYALGVILFEMVTGRVPFEGDTPLSVAYKHKNELPIAPRKLNSQVPEPLNKVILRCLEKDKANRYQTAEALLSDLALVEEGLPITERVVAKTRSTSQRSALRPSGVRRYLVPGLISLGIVVAALVVWLVLPRGKVISPLSGKPTIALLNFENLSGDPALDLWKEGLARLINIGLSQSKLITVLDPSSLYGIVKKLNLNEAGKYTREDLVKVATEGGATYTSTGSLMKIGQSIVIMLTLQKPRTGEVVESIKLTCQYEDDFPAKTDELVAKIKAAMDLTPAQLAADAGRGIQEVTTNSPEALKYYLESYEKFGVMDYAKARSLLEKAIELDPDFAMAYVMLAVFYEGDGNYAKGRELRKKALDLRDRLPIGERYKVEANYYLMLPGEDSKAKAIEAYEKYFEYAPRDAAELQSLGFCYFNSGDYAKSLDCQLRAYNADPSPQYLFGVLEGLQYAGQWDRAEETIKEFQKNNPGNPGVQYQATCLYINMREFDKALAEIERGFLLDPSPAWSWENLKGDVYLARGDLVEAERTYSRVIEKAVKPGYVSNAKSNLICLYILQGKLKRAAAADLAEALVWPGAGAAPGLINTYLRLNNFEKASEVVERYLSIFRRLQDPPGIRRGLLWKGIAAVEKHDLKEAEGALEELKNSALKSLYKNEIHKVEWLQGLIDLQKGECRKAIDNLAKACSELPFEVLSTYMQSQTLRYYPLALACFRAGEMPRARKEFERLTTRMGAKYWYGDLYAKSFYWLGKIAEAQKDKKRAVENYGKFLELWKDADPGQPEVDDARKRLDALR